MAERKITVKIDSDTSGLQRGVDRAADEVGGLGGKLQRGLTALPGVGQVVDAVGSAFNFMADSVQAAADEQVQTDALTRTIVEYTDATNEQAQAITDQTGAMQYQSSFSDDELRPALQKLVTATGDVARAQMLLGLASDIAAQTGKPLESVTQALVRAQDGQVGSLARLVPNLDKTAFKTGGLSALLPTLTARFKGTDKAANTTAKEGLEDLQNAYGDIMEALGEGLLPYLQKFQEFLSSPEGQAALKSYMELALAAGQAIGDLVTWLLRLKWVTDHMPQNWLLDKLTGGNWTHQEDFEGLDLSSAAPSSSSSSSTRSQSPANVTVHQTNYIGVKTSQVDAGRSVSRSIQDAARLTGTSWRV